MKIAVSSYSFQPLFREGKITQLDTVARAAEMGFDGIEFTDLRPRGDGAPTTLDEQLAYAAEIRAEAEHRGIAIVGYMLVSCLYNGDAEKDAAEVERLCGQIRVAAALGAPLVRHDVCYSEKIGGRTVSFERMLPTIAANVRAVTAYAETLGIRTCIENHGVIVQESDRVEKLYNAVAHDNYGILIDIGNFLDADADPVSSTARLAPYAIHAHVKDLYIYPYGTPVPAGSAPVFTSRACNRLVPCPVGEGDVAVKQCLTILKAAGYDGWLTVEYEGEDSAEGTARCLENLRKILGELI